MKRFLCLIMALAMLFSLSICAYAEILVETVAEDVDTDTAETFEAESSANDNLDSALTDVTLTVKDTLDVDDSYTDFYSNYSDYLIPTWYLSWDSDTEELSVTATTDGLILDVYRWNSNSYYDYFYGFDAAFPPVTLEEAATQAEYWLARLLDEDETARIDSTRITLGTDGYYSFNGTILKNGLESPLSFYIRIDETGLYIYYRSDEYDYFVGETPDAEAEITQEEAAANLTDAVELELYYVSDSDGTARLRYVPCWPETVVDAKTGDTVDMDALYASVTDYYSGNFAAYSTADAVAEEAEEDRDLGATLTEVELSSISNYADAMSQEELDKSLRSIETLGLENGYTLKSCYYNMNNETGDITATLRYSAEMTEERLFGYSLSELKEYMSYGYNMNATKTISVNAKTGQITYVSTSYPLYTQDENTQPDETSQSAAEAFLATVAGDMLAESELCTLSSYLDQSGYTYAQMHDGYFFPENYLYVRINDAIGTVDYYNYVWDSDVVFAESDGIVDETAALDAYVDALDVTLGYVAWPVAIADDVDGIYDSWAAWGYTYVQTLRLAWYFSGMDSVISVDALTGEPVIEADTSSSEYSYDDLEGVEQAEMIQMLAQAGIGFEGGSFQPTTELTQRDALILLLQADGYTPNLTDDERLQRQAVNAGFITDDEFDPDKTITRMEFMTMLLSPSRYGNAAELSGIWSSGFTDVEEDEGYAAIARALGLADGDTFRPDDICTRAEAAEFLYQFMSR